MRRSPLSELVKTFREGEFLKDGICTTEEQVAMLLHVAGHNQRG
jgi:hypothetical protein